MKTKRIIFCLLTATLCTGICLISCSNASGKRSREAILSTSINEDFQSFLVKFTSGAVFQYSRVKFPLKTPISLLTDDGKGEKEFPFTEEKWALLDSSTLEPQRIVHEEGGVYVSKFIVDEPKRKVFESGYEESEIDLRVEFETIDGKWYVTDCYTGWYGFDLTVSELGDTVLQVQEENKAFAEKCP